MQSVRHVHPLVCIFCYSVVCCLLVLANPAEARKQASAESTQWLAELQKLDGHSESFEKSVETVLHEFVGSDSRLVYETLRTGWAALPDRDVRRCLIGCIEDHEVVVREAGGKTVRSDTGKINPYLLDLLELGLSDTDNDIREAAQKRLFRISAHTFQNSRELRAWRSEQGAASVEMIARTTVQHLIKSLAEDGPEKLPDLLETLGSIGLEQNDDVFVVGQPDHNLLIHLTNASALTSLHKKAARDGGLLTILLRLLSPDQPATVRTAALKLLPEFDPDKAEFTRLEPSIRRNLDLWFNSRQTGFDLTAMMAKYPRSWYTEALLRQLRTATETTPFSMFSVIRALSQTGDLSIIPTLIALYDYLPEFGQETVTCNEALRKLTGTTQPYRFRGARQPAASWWRDWWSNNRQRFPLAVRSLRIPVLSLQWKPAAPGRNSRPLPLHLLAGDPDRAYYLFTPSSASTGRLPVLQPGNPITAPGPDRKAPLRQAGTALVVVLTDEDVRLDRVQAFWRALGETELKQPFAVALIMSPASRAAASAVWVTAQNRTPKSNSRFTTEQIVAEVVEDICKDNTIDRSAVYLAAADGAGEAGYCCALSPTTPFQGFLLLDAAFHSAQLPPLQRAAKRRLCLLVSREGGGSALFTQAASKVLQNAGATVHFVQEAGHQDSSEVQGRLDLLSKGLRWLTHAEK